MKDLRLEMRLRNNLLYRRVFDGWGSVAAFCLEFNLSQNSVGGYLNLSANPWSSYRNEYKPSAVAVAAVLGMLPEDLFPAALYEFERVQVSVELDSVARLPLEELDRLPSSVESPEAAAERGELREALLNALSTLNPAQRTVVSLRYGLAEGGYVFTLDELAQVLKCSRERVRQIEARGIRRLQSPERYGALMHHCEDEETVEYLEERGYGSPKVAV